MKKNEKKIKMRKSKRNEGREETKEMHGLSHSPISTQKS